MVAVSILILRYIPPSEVPLPSSFHESIDSVSLRYSTQEIDAGSENALAAENKGNSQHAPDFEPSSECPLIANDDVQGEMKQKAFSLKECSAIMYSYLLLWIITMAIKLRS